MGKRVLILKNDGYKKVGLFVDVCNSNERQYIKLEHDDARIEYISFDSVQSIIEAR